MTAHPQETRTIARKLDGKRTAAELEARLAELVRRLPTTPHLALINVGADYASTLYVKRKVEACSRVGIGSSTHEFSQASTEQIINLVRELNESPTVSGVLIQLPLPREIDTPRVLRSVAPRKDVDGFHPENLGQTLIGEAQLTPATPTGIMYLLEQNGISVSGKRAVVIGRSLIVGRPMAAMLTNADATVTLCHSRTQGLAELVREAEIVVTAVGSPWLIQAEMIQPGAVVVDVGINRTSEGRLVGDVHPEVEGVAGWISPVPGGVGPMTVSALLANTVKAHLLCSPSTLRFLQVNAPGLLGSLYPDLL